MTVSFIFAMDETRGIGIDNKMPWYLPNDFAYFKSKTIGHTILMGRKTFDSVGGKPLPKRLNVVLTRDPGFSAEGIETVHTAEEAMERYGRGGEELFVIGGAEVFRLFLPYVDRMYVTEILHRFPVDTYFMEMDMSEWREASRERGVRDERNPYDYDFVVYERTRTSDIG
ncbi:dihydrofolate reductase [Paenibacillus allorhizosphaerae]|uniref:Dihydrofolate reductase n=1 Tax=Paenibacillus allorhizosphaerae TaxID=2849866 RepID=A0ABN7TQC5_9BACL|nr:dihydrofolate reductase [Paenibacillus allorhizosphaerae]CAG7646334.1 Dihydrofolate reductase [Paenibacillus allorhizosphaerae]